MSANSATAGHSARQTATWPGLPLEVNDGLAPTDNQRLLRRARTLPIPTPRPHRGILECGGKVLRDYRERENWPKRNRAAMDV